MKNKNISIDGIWVFEVAGAFGWERLSTIFLEKGRYLGGGAAIHSIGTYTVKGKKVTMKTHVTQHGKRIVMYGEKKHHFSTHISAKIKAKGKKIEGIISLDGAKSTAAKYHVRWIKQAEIPGLPK